MLNLGQFIYFYFQLTHYKIKLFVLLHYRTKAVYINKVQQKQATDRKTKIEKNILPSFASYFPIHSIFQIPHCAERLMIIYTQLNLFINNISAKPACIAVGRMQKCINPNNGWVTING